MLVLSIKNGTSVISTLESSYKLTFKKIGEKKVLINVFNQDALIDTLEMSIGDSVVYKVKGDETHTISIFYLAGTGVNFKLGFNGDNKFERVKEIKQSEPVKTEAAPVINTEDLIEDYDSYDSYEDEYSEYSEMDTYEKFQKNNRKFI